MSKVWKVKEGKKAFYIEGLELTDNEVGCEHRDDAYLIAASTDLLEALEDILEHDCPPEKIWVGDAACTTVNNPRLEKARAAIKRAKGEA